MNEECKSLVISLVGPCLYISPPYLYHERVLYTQKFEEVSQQARNFNGFFMRIDSPTIR